MIVARVLFNVMICWMNTIRIWSCNLTRLTCFDLTGGPSCTDTVNCALSVLINHGYGTTRCDRSHSTALLVLAQDTKSPAGPSSWYSTSTLFNFTSCCRISPVSEKWPERPSTPTDGEVEFIGDGVRIVFRFNVSYIAPIPFQKPLFVCFAILEKMLE